MERKIAGDGDTEKNMKLDVLMSCMDLRDDSLIKSSDLTGDVIVINQCDREDYCEYKTANGTARVYSVPGRGLTISRNLAIGKSGADICMLCDDDEIFVENYEEKILSAYRKVPQADVIIFKMVNRPCSFPDRIFRLRFPNTMKVSSWQISFRRESLVRTGVRFDELLGAGTGNGAEEELKFLTDCQRAGLQIWFVPTEIASVAQTSSTWFSGFDDIFFYNRGATTRYILGWFPAALYAVYYVLAKYGMYRKDISMLCALGATLRGIRENKIGKLKSSGLKG